jgi:ArsR family transcriptional regulator
MAEEQFQCAAHSLKAISHPLRLKILCTLGKTSLNVHDLAKHVGSSQSNVSHHLATLRDKGVLVAKKDAKNVYYQLRDERMLGMIDMLYTLFCAK